MGIFYNTWEHNGVRIVDNYDTKQMELFFPNGNRQYAPILFKGERYLDEQSLDKRVNHEMIRYRVAYAVSWLLYFISAIFSLSLLYSALILPILIIAIHQHDKWTKNHYYGIFEEHYYKIREIRDREKELRQIDFLILQYK